MLSDHELRYFNFDAGLTTGSGWECKCGKQVEYRHTPASFALQLEEFVEHQKEDAGPDVPWRVVITHDPLNAVSPYLGTLTYPDKRYSDLLKKQSRRAKTRSGAKKAMDELAANLYQQRGSKVEPEEVEEYVLFQDKEN